MNHFIEAHIFEWYFPLEIIDYFSNMVSIFFFKISNLILIWTNLAIS